ncbi:MAG: sigma-70 family RNA polymerase sigma factor [Firmicutes bacterium]|jgi:RNA polymerase sporulation-specific sigma factor|uniref:RNA polymerase sigma factor SigS n=1 Tax=Sulfobacillus benefaciens TaxID=453960 RepID=A0A2T2XBN6_9FIRM|nr:sigma-70 family RNA polymerase sigma factor [Bacillota bacterium]MCL5014827.1 sigma-70 family RNA polymerase sigma factor [Bacillota bacterium]PSR31856.1 MAG: RNA polymerase sporulation sigma factor SigH [Sulfobacillus benefaciens]HBQ95213.1 RNA polymerase sporulation sigma factor SigH [Sulfobacillus sp.]
MTVLTVGKVQESDDDLLVRDRNGDMGATEELLLRYQGLVTAKARSYFVTGLEYDDLHQEGMLGLFYAIRHFREDHGVPFQAFADLCVNRRIISAVIRATRKKQQPLNTAFSLYQTPSDAPDSRPFIGRLVDHGATNPEHWVMEQESQKRWKTLLQRRLTSLERDVLRLYLAGFTYQQIAVKLGRSQKSVDNALQRIRAKASFASHHAL